MTTGVRLENFSYAWPGSRKWTLRKIDYTLPQGQCHCLTGASGSGKTTLSLALRGLLPEGRMVGCLHRSDAPWDELVAVGLVLQNPETQLLTDSVGAEVAFGLENLCIPPEQMPERIRAALVAVGLDLPFNHSTERLSMGQKYRLLLATQLVLNPRILIIDEPAGQLDATGLKKLTKIIDRLKKRGMGILLCEHRPGPLSEVINEYLHMDDTGHMHVGRSLPYEKSDDFMEFNKHATEMADPIVEVSNLSVAVADAAPAWQNASFVMRRGELVQLCAPNGAGKTTLLRCLAGYLKPESGEVKLFGKPPKPESLRGQVGYLFQNSRRQLFETTVFDEVAFTLHRTSLSSQVVEERVSETLERLSISSLTQLSPHRLSYGQQHLVALASILAPHPDLLLLDDPLAGLDREASSTVRAALVSANQDWGSSILWTSHHSPSLSTWTHRTLGIEGGQIVQNS